MGLHFVVLAGIPYKDQLDLLVFVTRNSVQKSTTTKAKTRKEKKAPKSGVSFASKIKQKKVVVCLCHDGWPLKFNFFSWADKLKPFY